jgi:hypothetical protein
MELKERCCGPMNFLGYCARKPTVRVEGRLYCWQHDPIKLKKEADEKRRARDEKRERDNIAHEAMMKQKRLESLSGVSELSIEDLEILIKLGGIRKILVDSYAKAE